MKLAQFSAGLCAAALAQVAMAQVFTTPAPKPAPATGQSRPRPAPRPRTIRPQAPAPAQSLRQAPQRRSFYDPITYCAANPDSDEIGATYVGQPMPGWVAAAMAPAPNAPSAGQSMAYNWRCMGARVLACASSADQSSCTRPSQEQQPAPELQQYCTGRRNEVVPASIAGNTVPIWACRNGQAVVTGYRSGLDGRGYFSNQWQDVTDYSPDNMIGVIPRNLVGNWVVQTQRSGLLGFQYRIFINIQGGEQGTAIGQAEYHQLNTLSGQPQLLCSTDLFPRGTSPRVLDLDEQYRLRTGYIACPVQGRLVAQLKDGRLWLEWHKPKDGKLTLSGWGQRN